NRCLSISPPPQRIFFAIRLEVHLSVAASVISPLTGLGCFAVLLLIGDQKLIPVSLSSPPVDRLCNEEPL
ncbi:hypothetical protein, partial [Salmonella enterica]|uniref:hypothetical protein n=1 Tax=Salmonella enterica TaxID=28901 RepID=UPI0033422D88